MKFVFPICLACVLGFVMACSSSNDSEPAASGQIDSEGGTVSAGKASVEVPEGALDSSSSITVAESNVDVAPPDGYTLAGPAIAFTPHGLSFGKPVTLRLPYSSSAAVLAVLRLEDEADTSWEVVEGGEFSGSSATLAVSSFSIYAVAAQSEAGGSGGTGGSGGSSGNAGESSGGAGGITGGGEAPVRAIRFANFAAAIQPFDLCFMEPSATEYVGPIFKAAGSTTGLTYGQVSSFRAVSEIGIHHFRFVAPNAADCSKPMLDYGGFEPSFNFNGDNYQTVTFTAPAAGGMFPVGHNGDDTQRTDPSDTVILELANLLPELLVDFGPVANGVFTPTFTNVGLSSEAASLPAPTAAAFELRETGTTPALLAIALTIPPKTTASAWVFGEVGSTIDPPKLVICTTAPNAGPLSDCQKY